MGEPPAVGLAAWGRRRETALRPMRPGPGLRASRLSAVAAIAVTFAAGLDTSLDRVHQGMDLAGILIAVAGALLPAGWAARISTARALRTE